MSKVKKVRAANGRRTQFFSKEQKEQLREIMVAAWGRRKPSEKPPEGKDVLRWSIEDGMVEHQFWNDHKRSKNWIATAKVDRASPGGIARGFWKSRKDWYKVPESLMAGDQLELAADYYSATGRKNPKRRYYEVIKITEKLLIVEQIEKLSR